MADIRPFCQTRQEELEQQIIDLQHSFQTIDRHDYATIPVVEAVNYKDEPMSLKGWLTVSYQSFAAKTI